jgi:ATP-dependent DNA helicase HFM1/MER3
MASNIIITTPEKWDSVTRKWKDIQQVIQELALVIIDEVHLLQESRGATLEAVVSRMKVIALKNILTIAYIATFCHG